MDNIHDDSQQKPNTASDLSKLKGISIGSLNIRSIFKHLEDIELLLHQSKLDILFLQESFLNSSVDNPIIEIEPYTLYRQDRNSNSRKSCGGGLLTYIHKRFHIEVVEEWSDCTPPHGNPVLETQT